MQVPKSVAGAMRMLARPVIAAILVSVAAAPAGATPNPVRYACPASGHFTVKRNSTIAYVRLAGSLYALHRERSGIGDKYLSRNAALIIDGASAVFVAPGYLNLGNCVTGLPMASAR